MRVEVQLVNELGRPLFTGERKVKASKHVGDLLLAQEHSTEYGRHILVARLQDTRGGIREPIVPILVDAKVLWIQGPELRLRGTERIDGVEYAQAWVAKVLQC
jgi:hypothetical protein